MPHMSLLHFPRAFVFLILISQSYFKDPFSDLGDIINRLFLILCFWHKVITLGYFFCVFFYWKNMIEKRQRGLKYERGRRYGNISCSRDGKRELFCWNFGGYDFFGWYVDDLENQSCHLERKEEGKGECFQWLQQCV